MYLWVSTFAYEVSVGLKNCRIFCECCTFNSSQTKKSVSDLAECGPAPAWPDLAKFRHYGKILQVFGKFLAVYLLFGKLLSLNLAIFISANGQILKNNPTIWSHWTWHFRMSQHMPLQTTNCKQTDSLSQSFHLSLIRTQSRTEKK